MNISYPLSFSLFSVKLFGLFPFSESLCFSLQRSLHYQWLLLSLPLQMFKSPQTPTDQWVFRLGVTPFLFSISDWMKWVEKREDLLPFPKEFSHLNCLLSQPLFYFEKTAFFFLFFLFPFNPCVFHCRGKNKTKSVGF